jgi:hypothetical protein
MLRSLLRVVLAGMLVSAAWSVSAQETTNRELLLAGNFATLERRYADEFAAGARGLDGELPSVAFFYGMEFGLNPASWPQDDEATRTWMKRSPESVPAAIARAFALARRAHVLDMGGDWAGVEAALREQERLLMAVQPKATKDMTWHTLYVGFGRQEGWPPARIKSAIEAGMDVDPTSVNFYRTAGRALAPDSLGSAEPLEWLARQGAARTVRTHGAAMYATIRLWTAEFVQATYSQPFGRGLIDWEMMDRGMTDLYSRNPNAPVLNQHAALACRAGDKAATAALLMRIGTKVYRDMWTPWGGVSHYENCKKWAESAAVRS